VIDYPEKLFLVTPVQYGAADDNDDARSRRL